MDLCGPFSSTPLMLGFALSLQRRGSKVSTNIRGGILTRSVRYGEGARQLAIDTDSDCRSEI